MPETAYPIPRRRSLDVFRGITVLGMVVVNAADLGGHAHPWLRHSTWNGCTPADLVFPGFLFILGTALALALRAYRDHDWTSRQIHTRVLRRALTLFALGVILNLLSAPDIPNLRIMGVLQRIGLCYLLAALVLLHLPVRAQWSLCGLLLLGYWAALRLVPVPGTGPEAAHLPGYLDRLLLGSSHLLQSSPYDAQMDPEGLLTTFPALCNVLLGAFLGRWLNEQPIDRRTSLRMFLAGVGLTLLGLGLSPLLPLNKALWTSSYALATSGAALIGFSVCHQLADVSNVDRPTRPFERIGLNAIVAYLVSTALNMLALRALHSPVIERSPVPPGPTLATVIVLGQILFVWALVEYLHHRRWYLKL